MAWGAGFRELWQFVRVKNRSYGKDVFCRHGCYYFGAYVG